MNGTCTIVDYSLLTILFSVVIEEKRNGIRNRDDHRQVSQQKQRETKPRENGTCDQSTAERKDLKDSAEMVTPAEADETELSRDSGTAAVKKDEDTPTISSVDENKVEGGQGGEVGEESSVPLLVETVGPQQEGERSRHEGESQLTEQVNKQVLLPIPRSLGLGMSLIRITLQY